MENIQASKQFDSLELKISNLNLGYEELNRNYTLAIKKLQEALEELHDEKEKNINHKIKIIELIDKIDHLEKNISSANASMLGLQMNFHFFINCLSSIRAKIIMEDRDIAAKMLSNLHGLLSYIFYNKEPLTSLSRELDITNRYIYIEKQRYGDKLNFIYDIEAFSKIDEHEVFIPPLLLQTLVENGIKHGINRTLGGGQITLTVTKEENVITISIKNPGNYIESNDRKIGKGIAYSRIRLTEAFGHGSMAKIKIYNSEIEENVVLTEVVIPYLSRNSL